jgi:hypothetical protein
VSVGINTRKILPGRKYLDVSFDYTLSSVCVCVCVCVCECVCVCV